MCWFAQTTLEIKTDTHLLRASLPISSADLPILAHSALTAALSLSVKLMLPVSRSVPEEGGDARLVWVFDLNPVASEVTPTKTGAKPRPLTQIGPFINAR